MTLLALANAESAVARLRPRAAPVELWTGRQWLNREAAQYGGTRANPIVVDLDRLRKALDDRFLLRLPDGRSEQVVRVGLERHGADALTWHGRIERDTSSLATFTVVGKAVSGTVLSSKGLLYRLETSTQGGHVIRTFEKTDFRADDLRRRLEKRRLALDASSVPCETDDPGQIDVLVTYSNVAKVLAGGRDAIEAVAYQAVAETNTSFLFSEIPLRIRLVNVAEVEYAETGDVFLDLELLQGGRAQLSAVGGLRDATGADIVVLLVEGDPSLGDGGAYNTFEEVSPGPSYAFAVVRRQRAVGFFTFGHEIGHILGADHDLGPGETDDSPPIDNHGHVEPYAENGGWQTMMSITEGMLRIPHWSNPAVAYPSGSGAMTGAGAGPFPQNNARHIRENGSVVARYRCSAETRQDVWMKDTWDDTGLEPEPESASAPMHLSPYIWVRRQRDSDLLDQHRHENPLAGRENFVYVKVHNVGPSSSGRLELYRTEAATGIAWPDDWTLVSSCDVASAGQYQSRIIEFPYTPDTPGHQCLLARYVSSNDPMASPETADVRENVRRNNNLIWRNLNVVDLDTARLVRASFLVRNVALREQSTALRVSSPRTAANDTFLRWGSVKLSLAPQLLSAWRRGGQQGSGFTLAGDCIESADPLGLILSGIRLGPREEARVDLVFERPPGVVPVSDEYLLNVQQFSGTGPRAVQVGGVSYQVRTR